MIEFVIQSAWPIMEEQKNFEIQFDEMKKHAVFVRM